MYCHVYFHLVNSELFRRLEPSCTQTTGKGGTTPLGISQACFIFINTCYRYCHIHSIKSQYMYKSMETNGGAVCSCIVCTCNVPLSSKPCPQYLHLIKVQCYRFPCNIIIILLIYTCYVINVTLYTRPHCPNPYSLACCLPHLPHPYSYQVRLSTYNLSAVYVTMLEGWFFFLLLQKT